MAVESDSGTECRIGRGILGVSLLDLRLGVRMLVVSGPDGDRHRGFAFAIAIGAGVFALISMMVWPTLPVPEGDRVVSVKLHDTAACTCASHAQTNRAASVLIGGAAGPRVRASAFGPNSWAEPWPHSL